LKDNKIDVAILANNHTRDYGAVATADMLDRLASAQLKTAGAGRTVDAAFAATVVEVPLKSQNPNSPKRTTKVAFIGLNDIENGYTNVEDGRAGSAYFDRARIQRSITAARDSGAAFVVVVPHWGVEYDSQQNSEQTLWAHIFIDAGADAVVGGHPHVVQPTETYKGKSIVYSMGNLIFDEMGGTSLIGHMIGLKIAVSADVLGEIVSIKSSTFEKPISIQTKIDDDGFPHLTQ
jgi:poly-gamma-glutamate capsule biosynthesis protein CapA/YwtB (metallophosphatase superfamily)